jgi:hypothetical protein
VVCLAALTTLAGCSGSSSSKSSSAATTTAAATSSASSTTESTPAATTPTTTAAPTTTTTVATTAPAAPSGKGFTVTLPAGYKSDPSKASGIVTAFYLGPIAGNFHVNVNVTREPAPGISVQAAQKQAVAGIKKVLKISNLSAVAPLQLDGESALSYSFEDTQAGLHLKQGQVVVLHKGYAYVLTFTAPVAQFAAQSPKAGQLIKSLKFT